VVAIFFWAGWELGAVEAISLSILVGSSVDYCAHVVEGYLLAGQSPPAHVSQVVVVVAAVDLVRLLQLHSVQMNYASFLFLA